MYLIDTDIIIYSLKGVTSVTDNFERHANAPKAISVISYGELVYGAQKSMQFPSNLAKINRIKEIFPIIDLSPSIMDCFGLLKAQLSKNGVTVDDFDLLIGATAITYGYTIVTNNKRHFSKIPDLSIENWNQ